ncbi:MAG: type II toxin-antitoxin system VapC family toxin [Burkholderiales bacterium]|nr:type II toxin-antitoxin system VapC family toxin [Burkholderiales bacterium]
MIVLDTHVLLWADNDERELGRKARALLERQWASGGVAACAMSFWEVALLQARGRIELTARVGEWRAELLAAGLLELPVDGAVGIRAVELTGLPEDPADRLIVACALENGAALLTADDKLLAWPHALVRHDARA